VAGTNAPATNAPSLFLDPLDHWFDASGFLDTRYGFLPMALPITEPAVGYGGAGGLMFVDRNPRRPDGKPVPPTLTGVAGAGTENGTWGIFALNSAWWRDGTIQTRVAGGYAKVNLKYYGLGNSPFNNNPLKYTLKPLGGLAEARFRLGQSDWMAGGGYVYAATEVSFDGNVVPPGINLPSSSSHMGGLKPVILYDSRDNIFTPTKGVYAQLYAGFYAPAFASDTSFQTIEPLYIFYLPLSPKWTFGLNTGGGFSFGEAPFYARPYVELRGVPVREYQADNVVQTEAELRWQFWKRYSIVGFAGGGAIWNDSGGNTERSVVSGGFGLRYELARTYGLHLGADVGFSRKTTALYITVGSAWFRP